MRLLRTFSVLLPSKAHFAGFPWVSMATLTYVKLICVTSPRRAESRVRCARALAPVAWAMKYGAEGHEPAPRGAWMVPAAGSITILGRDSQWIHPQQTMRRHCLAPLQLMAASTSAQGRLELGGSELAIGEGQRHCGGVGVSGVRSPMERLQAELAGDACRGGVVREPLGHDRQVASTPAAAAIASRDTEVASPCPWTSGRKR